MKTKISMNMPEALEAYDVKITAVAVLSADEYQSLLTNGTLPEQYLDRLKYTEAETVTPTSCLIKSYKALLVLDENSEHGVAVCGGDSVYRSGLFPNAREWLGKRIKQMADFICEFSHVPGAKLPHFLGMESIGKVFDNTVTADNGIGDLLLKELKKRNEISDIIMHEDCMEINYLLDYGQEALDTKAEWLTLAGLIGCNLHDVHLIHDSEEHDLATVVDLTPDTLTEQGKRDWADVLAAKVENISNGYYGTQIDLSGVKAERLRDFSYMLAGDCPVSDYDRWVNSDEQKEEQTIAPGSQDEGESPVLQM